MSDSIGNATELLAEKKRLRAEISLQEEALRIHVERVNNRLKPIQHWFSRIQDAASRGRETNKAIQRTIQAGIPLVIDRILLGTKGLVMKRVLTFLSGFLLKQFAAKKPDRFTHIFNSVMHIRSLLQRGPKRSSRN